MFTMMKILVKHASVLTFAGYMVQSAENIKHTCKRIRGNFPLGHGSILGFVTSNNKPSCI